jgi:hypothetical protein
MKVYVASSWRCQYHAEAVGLVRAAGHEVYDFRHPEPGNNGFAWSQIDPLWKAWDPARYVQCLQDPIADAGFALDMNALAECDACLLVLPCGRSAHLELGYACGAGKQTAIWIPEPCEPELMYKMVGCLCLSADAVIRWALDLEDGQR